MIKYFTNDGNFLYKSDEPPKKDFSGYSLHSDATKAWYKNGQIHKEDGPAVEWRSGRKTFVLNGLMVKSPNDEAFKFLVDLMKLKGLL